MPDEASALVARGRAAVAERRWAEAHDVLSAALAQGSMEAADLDVLAAATFALGRQDEYRELCERAHATHVEHGADELAAGDWA